MKNFDECLKEVKENKTKKMEEAKSKLLDAKTASKQIEIILEYLGLTNK